jgi:putative redox protein
VSTEILAGVDPASGRVVARTPHGAVVAMDPEPPERDDAGAGPKQALLAALAGCTGMDVCSILRKKRQTARTYEIAVRADSAADHPRVFTSIVVEHRVDGDVAPEPLRRSIELSATRYCPVNAMLSAVVRIEHRYRLTDASGRHHEALVAIVGPERRIEVIA